MTNCYKKDVKFCSVDSCMNAGLDICPLTGVKIEYHQFPKDRKLRRLWLKMCTIPTPIFVDDVNQMAICSVHFLRSDYKYSIFSGRKLKKSAYPTLELNAAWEVHQDLYLQKNNFYYKKNLMSSRKHTRRFYNVDNVSPHLPTKLHWDEKVKVSLIYDDETDVFFTRMNDEPRGTVRRSKNCYLKRARSYVDLDLISLLD